MYEIIFYTSSNNDSPITDFLDRCQLQLRSKILRQLKYVEEYGLNIAIPNIKRIKNTFFWELRILGKDNIRIITASLSKNKVIILNIFRKKQQKTPLKEISISIQRYNQVIDN